jgi:hypothetical protein
MTVAMGYTYCFTSTYLHSLLSKVDTFLLKKQKILGELVKVKVGHDNSGMGPGALLNCLQHLAEQT